jgi:hypothetical protein
MRDSWHRHLLETPGEIGALLDRVRSVAVLGIKPGDDPGQAAWFVPEYTQRAGLRIIPVPVYFPELTEILGERVYRTVAAIPGPVDLVNVFRRSKDVAAHVDDIIAKKPGAVWLQLGIRHDEAAERWARAGIDVVQDRCLLVELQERGR